LGVYYNIYRYTPRRYAPARRQTRSWNSWRRNAMQGMVPSCCNSERPESILQHRPTGNCL